jgi:hypothetical protein
MSPPVPDLVLGCKPISLAVSIMQEDGKVFKEDNGHVADSCIKSNMDWMRNLAEAAICPLQLIVLSTVADKEEFRTKAKGSYSWEEFYRKEGLDFERLLVHLKMRCLDMAVKCSNAASELERFSKSFKSERIDQWFNCFNSFSGEGVNWLGLWCQFTKNGTRVVIFENASCPQMQELQNALVYDTVSVNVLADTLITFARMLPAHQQHLGPLGDVLRSKELVLLCFGFMIDLLWAFSPSIDEKWHPNSPQRNEFNVSLAKIEEMKKLFEDFCEVKWEVPRLIFDGQGSMEEHKRVALEAVTRLKGAIDKGDISAIQLVTYSILPRLKKRK